MCFWFFFFLVALFCPSVPIHQSSRWVKIKQSMILQRSRSKRSDLGCLSVPHILGLSTLWGQAVGEQKSRQNYVKDPNTPEWRSWKNLQVWALAAFGTAQLVLLSCQVLKKANCARQDAELRCNLTSRYLSFTHTVGGGTELTSPWIHFLMGEWRFFF